MKITTFTTFALAALLTACGGDTKTASNDAKTEAPTQTRTCENIRDEVIRVAGTNGVTIVKIYEPKTIKTEPTKISCSGRAVVSTGQEARIFYRDYQDEDGDWLVQYSEAPLD